jgi:hypothetical protein
MFDRRAIGRTNIAKGALVFFNSLRGVYSCKVFNVTNQGAGIRGNDLKIVPIAFELTFDNFHTVRKCRLIWRKDQFFGVAFES